MSDALVVRALLVTGIGAGILIGATGLFVFIKFMEKKKNGNMFSTSKSHISKADLFETALDLVGLKGKSGLHNSRQSLTSQSSESSKSLKSCRDSTIGYESDDEMFSFCSSDTEYYDIDSDAEWDNEDAEKLFEEIDTLLKGNEEDRVNALEMLKAEKGRLSGNPDFLWRMAKLYQMQAKAFGADSYDEKRECIEQGLEYAEKALKIDPSNFDAHKWYAILVGMQAEFLPVKEKIQNGLKFRRHLSIALDGKPEDATLHHLLGRFKFEIANLSWVERKLASAFFSELPYFTMYNALHDFKEAEKLNSSWIENGLFIGKCYAALEDYGNASKWFTLYEKIKPITPEDRNSHDEITKLIAKYSRYQCRAE